MRKIEYYTNNESITNIKYSPIHKRKFNVETTFTLDGNVTFDNMYKHIDYPARLEFLEYIKHNEINHYPVKFIYAGFENKRIDFSTFIGIPHIVEFSSELYIESETEKKYKFNLKFCGQVDIFINGKFYIKIDQLTRMTAVDHFIELPLLEGENKIEIHYRDLIERDINLSYELIFLGNETLKTFVDISDLDRYNQIYHLLKSFHFDADIFYDNNISFTYDSSTLSNDAEIEIAVRYNDIPFENVDDRINNNPVKMDPNIVKEYIIKPQTNSGFISYDAIQDFTNYVIVSYKHDDLYFVRRIFLSKYTRETPTDLDYNARREYALNDIPIHGDQSIMKCYLDLKQNGSLSVSNKKILNWEIDFINSRSDCADFELVGLILLYRDFNSIIDSDLSVRIKQTILDFRYWVDEPGNDVMWYFSENHALTFHTVQFLAGNLFPDEVFTNSNKLGSVNAALGENRLTNWFSIFNKFGLGEWNASTYIPVNLNALFALYMQEYNINLTKQANISLDYIFETIQNNLSDKIMCSSFGRTYEKELKAFEFAEISYITWIMCNEGYVNNGSRAVGLYLISGYNYKFTPQVGVIQKVEGAGFTKTYTYKFDKASISTVLDYYPNEKGLQQHVVHVNLSGNTHTWINHPGEMIPSGEGRPAYWAGNEILPEISQDKNNVSLRWNLKNSLTKFVHMYLPSWKCTYELTDEYIVLKKNNYTLTVKSDNHYELVTTGTNANREIIFTGDIININMSLTENENHVDIY